MTKLSQTITVVAGLVTAAALLPVGTTPAVVVIVGTGLLAAGGSWGWQTGTNAGGALLLVGIVLAGVWRLSPQLLVVGTVTAFLAWDSSVTAVGLADQLDADTRTEQAETVHAGSTLAVAASSRRRQYSRSSSVQCWWLPD